MGIALHYREFHWAQRGRLGKQGSGNRDQEIIINK
jgi:hypothetical protein